MIAGVLLPPLGFAMACFWGGEKGGQPSPAAIPQFQGDRLGRFPLAARIVGLARPDFLASVELRLSEFDGCCHHLPWGPFWAWGSCRVVQSWVRLLYCLDHAVPMLSRWLCTARNHAPHCPFHTLPQPGLDIYNGALNSAMGVHVDWCVWG